MYKASIRKRNKQTNFEKNSGKLIMSAHRLQSPLNTRDPLSYTELEVKFYESCEAVSESGKELEMWYSYLLKELCDVKLDKAKTQLEEKESELEVGVFLYS